MISTFGPVTYVLLIAAFVVCLLAGAGRAPLWIAVLLVILANFTGLFLGVSARP